MPTDNPQPQQKQPSAAARVNERVEQGAQRVEQGVQSAADTAIQKVRDARERAERARATALARLGRVRRLGEALRQTSDQLTREDQLAQSVLDNVSERVQRVATYIDHARPEDLVSDLQSFARRQPALFFGGTFLVGLALGRFAKSSSSHGEPELSLSRRAPQRAPSVQQSAQREPGYDVRAVIQPSLPPASTTTTPAPTSTVAGSAFGADVPFSAPTNEPPKPQPATASTKPKVTEPGKGTKS